MNPRKTQISKSSLKSLFSDFRLLLFFMLFVPLTVHAVKVSKLTCEYQQEPLAVNTLHPRLGWQLISKKNGTMQSAYEIEVKSTDFDWNSAKVLSSQSQLIKYTGTNLQHGKKYQWRVRVWDQNGKPSGWSDWSFFRVAPNLKSLGNLGLWIGAIRADSAHIPVGKRFSYLVMRSPTYKAIWKNINPLSRRSIILRKPFVAKKTIKEAITYICGLGHYEFSINGKKVGDSEFAPYWSDYDKTVYYNTFDVTKLLRKGKNVFGVLLGNGFYNTQGGRYSKLRVSFGAPTLFFKTIIHYSDNTTQVIVSDKTWKYDLSPITFNDIYGGEDYDARLEQKGWNMPGFNDSSWKPVVVQNAPKGKLKPEQDYPVKIMQKLGVYSFKHLTPEECKTASKKTKRTIDPSAIVFDMYQNLSGFPQITVRGKRGDKITLLVGEQVTSEGAVNQRQTGRPYYYQYTLKGGGDETWHPRFSYYGFHYIQVEGAVLKGEKNPRHLPVLKDVKSCFVRNSAPLVSTFKCSNEIFNKTHLLILKAVESNMQGIFTDCPQREKLGWLEQLHLNGPGLMYNFDLASFLPKIMQDIADAQQPDGMIPTIAPMYDFFGKDHVFDDFGNSTAWGSTFLILPHMYMQFYGDSTLIIKNYERMRKYVDYLTSRAEDNVLSFGLGDWYDYGNFRAGFSHNTPVPFVATAYYFYDLKLLSKYALMVGSPYDHQYYGRLAEKVRQTINTKFFNNNTKEYATGSQTALSMAVYMNIVKPENRQAVLDNLVKDIHKHGNRLTTGDIGNRYLFRTLATNGLNNLMYKMQDHEDVPGYGFQIKMGATTLTEQWDPRKGASWDHFMMGQIDEWFFRSLAGIQPQEIRPGYQHFVIRPEVVGDMTYVKASTVTLYGKVAVDWKLEGKKFTLKVQIPANCTAEIYLPGEKLTKNVESGTYSFVKNIK